MTDSAEKDSPVNDDQARLRNEKNLARRNSAYELAIALLFENKKRSAACGAVLALPSLLDLLFGSPLGIVQLILSAFDQILEVGLIVALTHYLFTGRFFTESLIKAVPILTLFSLLLGPFLGFPLLFAEELGQGFLLFWGVIALSAVLMLYFFFVGPIRGVLDPKSIIAIARSYPRQDPYIVVRVLFPPLVLQLLALGIIRFIFSEDTSWWGSTLLVVVFGLQKLLLAHLSAAFAVLYLPGELYEAGGIRFDPQVLPERFAPSPSTSRLVRKILSPRGLLPFFLLAILFWGIASSKLEQQPLNGTVTALSYTNAGEKELTVEFTIVPKGSDGEVEEAEFLPAQFSLQTENGAVVAPLPVSGTMNGKPITTLQKVVAIAEPTTLALTFKTGRTETQLKKLESLWLWYRSTKTAPLF